MLATMISDPTDPVRALWECMNHRDWDSVARLDDVALINGVSQIAPFDAAAKQALLEAANLRERCDLLVQLMEFFGRGDPDDEHVTLQ